VQLTHDRLLVAPCVAQGGSGSRWVELPLADARDRGQVVGEICRAAASFNVDYDN
jgi:hypothetical protein